MADDETILQRQLLYYRARAAEYHEWHERLGRYDKGPDHAERWGAAVDELDAALLRFAPGGDVVELAGGTGWWSARLVEHADRLLVVDAAPETLELNRARCASRASERGVEYHTLEADLFAWRPSARFDVVFFSFWLSHVPRSREASFWQLVHQLLAPDGRFFFIDSLREPESIPSDHRLPEGDDDLALRRLNDGSSHHVIKRFFEPAVLREELARAGFVAEIRTSGTFFIYGHGRAR